MAGSGNLPNLSALSLTGSPLANVLHDPDPLEIVSNRVRGTEIHSFTVPLGLILRNDRQKKCFDIVVAETTHPLLRNMLADRNVFDDIARRTLMRFFLSSGAFGSVWAAKFILPPEEREEVPTPFAYSEIDLIGLQAEAARDYNHTFVLNPRANDPGGEYHDHEPAGLGDIAFRIRRPPNRDHSWIDVLLEGFFQDQQNMIDEEVVVTNILTDGMARFVKEFSQAVAQKYQELNIERADFIKDDNDEYLDTDKHHFSEAEFFRNELDELVKHRDVLTSHGGGEDDEDWPIDFKWWFRTEIEIRRRTGVPNKAVNMMLNAQREQRERAERLQAEAAATEE